MSMITTAKLTCLQCNNAFPINLNNQPESITCPFCQTDVSNDMINDIYKSALSVADLNYHFDKYAGERNDSNFKLSVKAMEVKLPFDNIE